MSNTVPLNMQINITCKITKRLLINVKLHCTKLRSKQNQLNSVLPVNTKQPTPTLYQISYLHLFPSLLAQTEWKFESWQILLRNEAASMICADDYS